MVRSWIEFHDSEVSAIINSGGDMLVQLSAYVHRWEHRDGSWVGTGWMQPVRIVLKNARSQSQTLSTPTELTDGCVRVGASTPSVAMRRPVSRCHPLQDRKHSRDERQVVSQIRWPRTPNYRVVNLKSIGGAGNGQDGAGGHQHAATALHRCSDHHEDTERDQHRDAQDNYPLQRSL